MLQSLDRVRELIGYHTSMDMWIRGHCCPDDFYSTVGIDVITSRVSDDFMVFGECKQVACRCDLANKLPWCLPYSCGVS